MNAQIIHNTRPEGLELVRRAHSLETSGFPELAVEVYAQAVDELPDGPMGWAAYKKERELRARLAAE